MDETDMQASIPVYIIAGFLDSGKTTLLADTLQLDYFNDGQRTVLLLCEDGETSYDQKQLSSRNCRLVPVEAQTTLTTDFLQEVDRRYQPERVLIEYNGMWPLGQLLELDLPKEWGIYQIICTINGESFELYRNNMQSLIIDMVSDADMVLFNRCDAEMPLANWKRSIRAVNRMGEIMFESGAHEDLKVKDILPYSLADAHLTLDAGDYGIWYIDIQENPTRYVGKTITYLAQALTDAKLPKGTFIAGRNAMTCCIDDIRFFGFLCKYDKMRTLKRGAWVRVTAEIHWEESPVYEGEGIVLYVSEVQPAAAPEDPLVYFR